MKPVIILIDKEQIQSYEDNPDRFALSYYLENQRGCEVLIYDSINKFEKDFDRARRLYGSRRLILVIMRQQEHSKNYLVTIEKLREEFGPKFPVIVIFENMKKAKADVPQGVDILDYFDAKMMEKIGRLLEEYRPPVNFYGAETEREVAELQKRFEEIYRDNYLENEDDRVASVPDHNARIVLEAIRIKILPAELMAKEWDERHAREQAFSPDISATGEFEAESSRLRCLAPDERLMLRHGLFKKEVIGEGILAEALYSRSYGENVSGYAIDPLTLNHLVSTGYAQHFKAMLKLARRIAALEAYRRNIDYFELPEGIREECESRIINGLVIHQVEGFTLPFIYFRESEIAKPEFSAVLNFIKNQKKFIPVDDDCNLL